MPPRTSSTTPLLQHANSAWVSCRFKYILLAESSSEMGSQQAWTTVGYETGSWTPTLLRCPAIQTLVGRMETIPLLQFGISILQPPGSSQHRPECRGIFLSRFLLLFSTRLN